MMQFSNIEKVYGDNVIFNKANLNIQEKDKVALLGQNGTGKTTFFRCIAGEEHFEGEITMQGTVAVMEQEKTFDVIDMTFNDYLQSKQDQITKRMEELEEQMGLPEVYENEKRYNRVLHEYTQLSSRTTESKEVEKQKDILVSLGYATTILNKPINSLSGGQRTALRLTEVLSKEADILLLDEPTNHLDFASIQWLERQLHNTNQTIIIISHDRFFLDRFVNVVVEIENKQFVKYTGNYSSYLVKRVEHRALLAKERDSIEAKRKSLLDSALQKRTWAHKDGNKSMRIQADRLEREANDLPHIPDPNELENRYNFSVKEGKETGKLVFETKGVSKSFEHQVFTNVDVSIEKGERIGIVGENGSGKTTLLKVLTNLLEADSGSIYKAMHAHIGYFDQEGEDLPKNKKVREYLMDVNSKLEDHQISNLAQKFGLDHDLPKKQIKSLSGGEKARLQLMALFNGGYNVLVLDEPTNHLDLELREALERALKSFSGTVLFVTHDRFFMDKVATQLIHIENGTVKQLKGGYSVNFN